MRENYESLLKELDELKSKVQKAIEKENQPEKKGRWKPKEGDVFWHIGAFGAIFDTYFTNGSNDNKLIARGNCYQTKELAQRQADKEQLITDIWDWWYEHDGVWLDWEAGKNKYCLTHHFCSGGWEYVIRDSWKGEYVLPVFSHPSKADDCIEAFKDRLDILLIKKRWEDEK